MKNKSVKTSLRLEQRSALGGIILNVLILLVGEKFLKEIKIVKDKELF